MLEKNFKQLCHRFSKDKEQIEKLWKEIKSIHTTKERYYHNMKHLEYIYNELSNPDSVMEFSIFYHDIIYNVTQEDNEEQSALLCKKRLENINLPSKYILEITQLIHETKTHIPSSKRNALFLDADLAILASCPKIYNQYLQNIRKEYVIYSDTIYNTGRKKILKYFLEKERIYMSDYFYELYEDKARNNITIEYNSLI